jgi:glutaredoxin
MLVDAGTALGAKNAPGLSKKLGEKMKVVIKSRDDCKFCTEAKMFLQGMDIEYTEEEQPDGRVPQIYINDEFIGGYTELIEWAVEN